MKNHLVVIGLHWPEPESTAAGLRMLQLLELFQSLGYEITFYQQHQRQRIVMI